MKYPVNRRRPGLARACLILLTTTALAVGGGAVGGRTAHARDRQPAVASPVNGPQADYPVTIGAAYEIQGTTYRPADVLNYDEVGYATAGDGAGITGAHHTLPVPSYVEVTSLESGRTTLLRLERRGPMDSRHLVSLSPAAMVQLGANGVTPVRVRRVNPPEAQRALLRAGEEAPLRMDTPRGLVDVLRRRLPAEGSVSLQADAAPPPAPAQESSSALVIDVQEAFTTAFRTPDAIEATAVEPSQAAAAPISEIAAMTVAEPTVEEPHATEPQPLTFALPESPSPAPAPAPQVEQVVTSGFVVQAGSFSVEQNADRAAHQVGGTVSRAGTLYRVRTGPFSTRAQAEASLANVRAAGYSDARIYTTG
jgi:rare lipoprotein A